MEDGMKALLCEITVKLPKSRIVLRGSKYYLVGDDCDFKIIDEVIDSLVHSEHLKKNTYGGLEVTQKTLEAADSDSLWELYDTMNSHNRKVRCCKFYNISTVIEK